MPDSIRSYARGLAKSKKKSELGSRKDQAHKSEESTDLGKVIASKIRRFRAMKGLSKRSADKKAGM